MKKVLLLSAFGFLVKKLLPQFSSILFVILFINIPKLSAQSVNDIDCSTLTVPTGTTCGNLIANPSFEYYSTGNNFYTCYGANITRI